MFRNIFRVNPISSTFSLWKNDQRSLNTRKFRRALRRYLQLPQVKPPYIHVTQIGDPVLRAPTLPVEPQVIPLLQFQVVIEQMKKVMKKYNNVGLAAPQIGLQWQVFMIQIMEKHMKEVDENIRNIRGMELVPLQIFINPTMKIVDHKLISFPESCASFLGYNAVVPRVKAVEITALNDKGEKFTASFKDWTARIVQHEMDHLKGILYTDRMERKTLTCSCWNEINIHEGNIELRFDS